MKIRPVLISISGAMAALLFLSLASAEELSITAPIMEVAVPCQIIYVAEERVILGKERIDGEPKVTCYFDKADRPMKKCQLEEGEMIALKAIKVGDSYFATEIHKKEEG